MPEPKEKWPFLDYDVPIDAVLASSPLASIVSVHLELEGLLSYLLGAELPEPDALEIDRMGFAAIARLSVATGIVYPGILPALLKLNSFRNRLAHRRGATITAEDEAEFRRLLVEGGIASVKNYPDMAPQSSIAIHVARLMAWLSGQQRLRLLLRERPELASRPDELHREYNLWLDEHFPPSADARNA